MIFSIDGIPWNLGCTIKRTAEMTPSEISGMLLDKSYFNDVIGTFMRYDVQIEVPYKREESYNRLYEQITKPVDAHVCVLPYGGGTIKVTGRITDINDVYVRLPKGKIHWQGIQFSIIANHPTKTMSLDTVLTRGATDLPPESAVNVGEVYIYTSSGWQTIPDTDDNYY